MEKFLDKLESIIRRWFYITALAVVIVGAIICALVTNAIEKRVYEIPNGACYCPSCGMVMVLEGNE